MLRRAGIALARTGNIHDGKRHSPLVTATYVVVSRSVNVPQCFLLSPVSVCPFLLPFFPPPSFFSSCCTVTSLAGRLSRLFTTKSPSSHRAHRHYLLSLPLCVPFSFSSLQFFRNCRETQRDRLCLSFSILLSMTSRVHASRAFRASRLSRTRERELGYGQSTRAVRTPRDPVTD